jgi:hypothetical protein
MAGNTISSARSWHHSTRLATQHHQHEAGIIARGWQHIITTRGWKHIITARGWHTSSQHEAGTSSSQNEAGTSSQHKVGTSSARGWHHNTRLETQHYSPFRGRSLRITPSLSRKCSNFTRDRGLVNTSATYSSVLTYWSFMAPLCTISWM